MCPNHSKLSVLPSMSAGEALYRLDDDASARWYWEQATKVPENPTTYAAWRHKGPRNPAESFHFRNGMHGKTVGGKW